MADAVTAGVEADVPEVCGIVMPISAWGDYDAQHWNEVRDIINRAVAKAGMTPRPVWKVARRTSSKVGLSATCTTMV